MVNLENKLDMFYDVVYKKREEDARIHFATVKRMQEQERRNKLAEFNKNKEERIRRREELARQQAYESLAKAEEQRRVLELQKTDALLRDFMEHMREKSATFTDSPEYKYYLTSELERTVSGLKPGIYRIGMTKKDWKRYEKELRFTAGKYDISLIYVPMEDDIIGGFIISDKEDTYNLNNTLRGRILNNKYEMGMMLHEVFAGGEGHA